MSDDKAVTTIRVPKSLQGRYNDLPKKYWLNFPDFCREAIREKLTQEERLRTWVVEDATEDGPPCTPRESVDKDKPR